MDELKLRILAKLDDAVSQNLVDEDVIPLLFSLNDIEDLVTTSSCSGCFQIISMPGPGDKRRSVVLGKWHRKVTKEEVMDAIQRWDSKGELHLMVQPILAHIRCRDLGSAVWLRNLAHGAGLKFSTIRSIRLDSEGRPAKWGTMVEIMGTERIEAPIDGLNEMELDHCLDQWVPKGNALLERTKGHIPDLIKGIDGSRGNNLDISTMPA